MKASCLRWIIAILMLLCLALNVSSPVMAESGDAVPAVLPMAFTEGGRPVDPANWVYNGDLPAAYNDPTIDVTVERGTVTLRVNRRNV